MRLRQHRERPPTAGRRWRGRLATPPHPLWLPWAIAGSRAAASLDRAQPLPFQDTTAPPLAAGVQLARPAGAARSLPRPGRLPARRFRNSRAREKSKACRHQSYILIEIRRIDVATAWPP
jgi:hypothetical protein